MFAPRWEKGEEGGKNKKGAEKSDPVVLVHEANALKNKNINTLTG